jgi:hypothetical protein
MKASGCSSWAYQAACPCHTLNLCRHRKCIQPIHAYSASPFCSIASLRQAQQRSACVIRPLPRIPLDRPRKINPTRTVTQRTPTPRPHHPVPLPVLLIQQVRPYKGHCLLQLGLVSSCRSALSASRGLGVPLPAPTRSCWGLWGLLFRWYCHQT